MKVLETKRLALRHLVHADAAFILRLLNDADWIRHIGDRGVRTEEAARAYMDARMLSQYEAHGFGLWLVEPREGGAPMGICGLVRRDTLPGPDLGFAFMPAFRGQGYAYESALAVRDHATQALGIPRLLAITSPANHASARLLERLGFVPDLHTPVGSTPDHPVRVFAYPG